MADETRNALGQVVAGAKPAVVPKPGNYLAEGEPDKDHPKYAGVLGRMRWQKDHDAWAAARAAAPPKPITLGDLAK